MAEQAKPQTCDQCVYLMIHPQKPLGKRYVCTAANKHTHLRRTACVLWKEKTRA